MKLNYKRTIFVGFAFFLICAFWQAYDTIIPKILTDKFGMSQTLSGVIMAADNVLALFLLPLFGTISDKCKSRRGRRTPFIIFGTVAAAVLFVVLSFADDMQIKSLAPVAIDNPTAQETLYDADLTAVTPDGETFVVQDEFTREEFVSIEMTDADGGTNPDYTNYVVPARQAYAAQATAENRTPLILFVGILLLVLHQHGHLPEPSRGADARRDDKAPAQQGQRRYQPHGRCGRHNRARCWAWSSAPARPRTR